MYISSLHYKKEGLRKVAVCIYRHLLLQGRIKKSCGMYILSLYYDKEGGKKLQYVYIITLL